MHLVKRHFKFSKCRKITPLPHLLYTYKQQPKARATATHTVTFGVAATHAATECVAHLPVAISPLAETTNIKFEASCHDIRTNGGFTICEPISCNRPDSRYSVFKFFTRCCSSLLIATHRSALFITTCYYSLLLSITFDYSLLFATIHYYSYA